MTYPLTDRTPSLTHGRQPGRAPSPAARPFVQKLWTQDEIDTLVTLQAQGWTLGGIARKLKRTRGSVIGRAWRMSRNGQAS